MNPADFVVRGGGIIGICIARELKRRYGDPSVAVLEKAPPAAACPRPQQRGDPCRILLQRGQPEGAFPPPGRNRELRAYCFQAESVARNFGFSRTFRILPLKGLSLHSEESPGWTCGLPFARHVVDDLATRADGSLRPSQSRPSGH
jgi:Predicted dehydrogenase